MSNNEALRKKPRRRLPWAAAAALLLAAIALTAVLLHRSAEEPPEPDLPAPASAYGELTVHTAQEVQSVRITLRSGENYSLTRSDGDWTLGEGIREPSASRAEALASAMAVISYERIIAEHAEDWQDHPEAFGFDPPRVTAEAVYADGTSASLRVGNRSAVDHDTWYYMSVDGDERLFALDRGTADALCIEQERLYDVSQPALDKQRIDRITLTSGETVSEWTLSGSVTDETSLWRLTCPAVYPADHEAMNALLDNLVNIRFGAFTAEDTPENRTAYGFTEPRMTIAVHMAAGTVHAAAADGSLVPEDRPEQTFTLLIGGGKNDMVDYVLSDGAICTTSHFTVGVFLDLKPMNTVSAYAVHTPLSCLRRLTVLQDGTAAVYEVSKDTVKAEDGSVRTVSICEKDGSVCAWGAFEAAYARLENVTMTGRLPEGWSPAGEPETVYELTDTAGAVHRIALAPFDALHDAVFLDGTALFYLIRDGMTWQMDASRV